MHLAFRDCSKQTGRNLTLPYTTDIASTSQKIGWKINHIQYKTFDDWVLGAIRAMSVLGITNFRYSFPDKAQNELARVRFHFVNEGDKLRFECMILGNTRADFVRKIFATTPQHADEIFKSVVHFLKEQGFDGYVRRLTPERIEVVTHNRMDDLAIYQYATQRSMKLALPPKVLALEYAAGLRSPK